MNLQQPHSLARRHFLGITAAATGRVAATAALATTLLSSTAEAKNGNNGNHNGWNGNNGNHNGHGTHCFLRGTHILTSEGEVRVEDLEIGDLVVTLRGETMPIKWIGYRAFKKCGQSWHRSVMPIRVSRFAIDDRTPHADLYLSPRHALFIDSYLMPVKDLVNGISITPHLPDVAESIEYFHIVLGTHEVIFAEGTPAETLLMLRGVHEDFSNFAAYERLYPDDDHPAMIPFAQNVGYRRWAHVAALLRLGASQLVDVRDPIQRAYDRLAVRAQALVT